SAGAARSAPPRTGRSAGDTATLLVLEMQRHHDDPLPWLRRNRERLVGEARRLGVADRALLDLLSTLPEVGPSSAAAEEALAELAVRLAPHERPRYRGHPVDEDGLVALACGGAAEQALLRRLLGERSLIVERYAARHLCRHGLCVGKYLGRGCRILRRLRSEVAAVVEHTREPLRELRHQIWAEHDALGHPRILLPPDRELTDRVHATALLVRRRSSELDRHREEVLALRCPTRWWASQQEAVLRADPDTDRGLAWVVIASVAAETARPSAEPAAPKRPGPRRGRRSRRGRSLQEEHRELDGPGTAARPQPPVLGPLELGDLRDSDLDDLGGELLGCPDLLVAAAAE